jgi:hypothetical protein
VSARWKIFPRLGLVVSTALAALMLSANAAAQAPPVSYPQPPPDFAHPSTPHPGRGEGRPSKFSYFGGNLDRPMLVI